METEWNEEAILKLIELYKKEPIFYDTLVNAINHSPSFLMISLQSALVSMTVWNSSVCNNIHTEMIQWTSDLYDSN